MELPYFTRASRQPGCSHSLFTCVDEQLCITSIPVSGSRQWFASQVRDNKGTSVTAALPPEFQRMSLERGLWPLRLPDVKPPCTLAPLTQKVSGDFSSITVDLVPHVGTSQRASNRLFKVADLALVNRACFDVRSDTMVRSGLADRQRDPGIKRVRSCCSKAGAQKSSWSDGMRTDRPDQLAGRC
jgi:hypothetical protein